jgi:hypothetical protein
MRHMKIIKKIEVEILKLKLATEDLKIAESNLKEGTEDLHFRLSYFRKQVSDKDIDKYDLQFFGGKLEDIQKAYDKPKEVISSNLLEKTTNRYKKKEPWLKKIYRKVVGSTHPDKFENLTIKPLKEKYLKIYLKAIESWNNDDNAQLLLCAHETNIKIVNSKAIPILQNENESSRNRLKEIKGLFAYQWYHVPKENRAKTFENYLKQLGYKFTIEEIKKVIHFGRKRKVGTRPKSLKEIRKLN